MQVSLGLVENSRYSTVNKLSATKRSAPFDTPPLMLHASSRQLGYSKLAPTSGRQVLPAALDRPTQSEEMLLSAISPPPAKRSMPDVAQCPARQYTVVGKLNTGINNQTEDGMSCNDLCSCHDIKKLSSCPPEDLVNLFNKHLAFLAATISCTRWSSSPKPSLPTFTPTSPSSATPTKTILKRQPSVEKSHASPSKPDTQRDTQHGRCCSPKQPKFSPSAQEDGGTRSLDIKAEFSSTRLFPCVNCSRPAVFVCSKCRHVWYCSTECQVSALLYVA